MTEGKDLGAELGVGAGADEHEVEDEADEVVGEAEKHARGTRPAAATIRAPARWPCQEVYPAPAPEVRRGARPN